VKLASCAKAGNGATTRTQAIKPAKEHQTEFRTTLSISLPV
jgi:hypothetical protein